jgi:uncharacterized protein
VLIPWETHADGLRLSVRVTPRASVNSVGGLREGRLCVKVTAVAEDGKANAAVLRLLSKALGLAPSRLEITGGAASRDKTLLVRDAALGDVPAELGGP